MFSFQTQIILEIVRSDGVSYDDELNYRDNDHDNGEQCFIWSNICAGDQARTLQLRTFTILHGALAAAFHYTQSNSSSDA